MREIKPPIPDEKRSKDSLLKELADLRLRERQLRTVIDTCPVPLFLKDTEGRYLLANKEYQKWYNQKESDILGGSLDLVLSPERVKVARERDLQVLNSGESSAKALDWTFPDGVTRQTIGVKFPVYAEDGKPIGVGGVRTDVTALRVAEAELEKAHKNLEQRVEDRTRELRESESRFRDFAEATTDSFWEMDADLCFSNTTLMRDSIHSTTNEIIGKTRWAAVGADAQNDSHWSAHRRDMEAHRPFRNFEYWLDDKTGVKRCISISGVPQFGEDGEFLGYRGGATDVTILKQAQDAVRAALEEARNADKAKQDFLANMSHELRTPLNAIMGFSEVIQMEYFGPLNNTRYLDYANDISHSAKHLLELVNDILDLSKIEAGKLELSFTDIDLAAVATAALRELQGQMRKKSQHFSMDINPDAAKICADGSAVRQMLTNLLSNAVKFTPKHGAIMLSVGSAGLNAIKITVSDSGIGIPESDIQKVLSPFGQSGDIKLAREGGTGLGLPIVGELAKLHGGVLEIDSVVGTGTQVHIMLPKDPKFTKVPDAGNCA